MTKHPKKFIQEQISSLIHDVYGIEYQPRVVRQERNVKIGSLNFIDYSIPCFELSRLLNINPEIVSRKLSAAFNNSLATADSHIKSESIGGYLNFLLQDVLIEDMLRTRSFMDLVKTGNSRFTYKILNFGALHLQPEDAPYQGAEKRLLEVLRLITKNPDAKIYHYYEMDDDITIKKFIDDHNYEINRINKELVNRYIDTTLIYASHIKSDMDTKAVYFIHDEEALPIRSAVGRIYSYAYIAYLLHEYSQGLINHSPVRLIAFMPQRIHAFIYSVIDKQNILLFDPNVSKADIDEIEVQQKLEIHVSNIKSLLRGIPLSCLQDSELRKTILTLLDLEYDLTQYSSQLMLPAIYSTVNDSYTAFLSLARESKGVMQVTAD